ncbi:MurR/RpiR family transcriptional regulator [Companilactobacillus insicii]|uniref:MurR/RpiR family transcriptional regulator n=1 Tax=Companilactobacillus insicii TaxID=1732567 RepID=UPI000F7819F4|nr:MurR/RpiR family transcriptional regulator [Companilactobacillus insicii]
MNTLKLIEDLLPSLSRQERKVAIKIIQDSEGVQKMSINTLAKNSGVSNATITRFVKKMNCKDFYELKLKLAGDKNSEPATIKSGSITDEVYSFYKNVLNDTWERLDIDQLRKIVEIISNGRRIYLFGIGSSGYTAMEMTQRLLRMGIAAFPMTESNLMSITSSIVDKNDVILALSSSGNTTGLNNALQMAKSNDATIIGITGIEKSPMYDICDYPVLVKNSNFVNNTRFINSQFALTYALDIITTMLLENDTYRTRLNHTVETVLDNKFDKN